MAFTLYNTGIQKNSMFFVQSHNLMDTVSNFQEASCHLCGLVRVCPNTLEAEDIPVSVEVHFLG